MFIQTESTPNPATLKFLPCRAVLDHGNARYARQGRGKRNRRWRSVLFEVAGISGVFFGSDFIAVTKRKANGSSSSRRSSAPSWSISCRARRSRAARTQRRRCRRIFRAGGFRDRHHHQGTH